jgi:hypothetical protein
MALDSDIQNADSHLHVEFYLNDQGDYKANPKEFVRIIVPGDKTNVVDQPVREDHKERFPRQYLYWKMQSSDASAIGTPLEKWNTDFPEELNSHQMAELQILKFQTVEQIATATDSQIQRVGMGASGLREKARLYLTKKNKSQSDTELEETRAQLKELREQMAMLMEARKPGRPRKEAEAV